MASNTVTWSFRELLILRRVRLREQNFLKFYQYLVRVREPASFWRGNVIAVFIVVAAETSSQKFEVLSFCDQERALPPSIKTITVLTFVV